MDRRQDKALTHAFAAKCEQARADLRRHMKERGLHAEEGWLIHEAVAHRDGGTHIVMRPIHRQLPAPADLECSCSIDEPGEKLSSQCNS